MKTLNILLGALRLRALLANLVSPSANDLDAELDAMLEQSHSRCTAMINNARMDLRKSIGE